MTKQELIQKLTSRKFWLAVVAFLSSLGTGIAGLRSDNELVAAAGIVCTMLSAAIYAATEAYVDAARLAADTKTTTISATTSDRKLVGAALNPSASTQTQAAPAPETTDKQEVGA